MNFIERRLKRLQHLSDETISRLLSGELSTVRSMRARAHIAKCWQCRSRHEGLNRSAMRVAKYRRFLADAVPPDPQRRALLAADLRSRSEKRSSETHSPRAIFQSLHQIRTQMTPVLASVAIVASAVCLLAWVWSAPKPPMSVEQVLKRAALADQSVSREKSGVIYQKVSITTKYGGIEHESYLDVSSVRVRRPEVLKADAEPIRKIVTSLGMDWQSPLSADSYQRWHDQQTSVSDQIKITDGNLLTVISKVPGGPIEEESLTVRASDFHPVQRTVESRDYGTIEIAELNYAVLDWSGINEALFEPLSAPPATMPTILPALPTTGELDNAELAARVALNRLHADEGEQISVSRTNRMVEVKGVVETTQRKREITSKLAEIPHVLARVLSLDELPAAAPNSSTGSPVQVQLVDAQPSPLEKYLANTGRRSELDAVSRGVLDAALKMKQNAMQLETLKRTSSAGEDSTNQAVSELSQSYVERFQRNLSLELSTLDSLQLKRNDEAPVLAAADLSVAVDRNEALCRELVTGSANPERAAAEIIPDLYQTIAAIRSALATHVSARSN